MSDMSSDEETVNLLWTGGWDSTFQLLRLLITYRRRVTPFYLINAERESTGVEIKTMKRIKERLLNEHPHIRTLLQPTRYFAVADISPDREITKANQAICTEKSMGGQYEWLSRFCKEYGIADMQLCIHRDDKAHFVVEQIVSETTDGCQSSHRVSPRFKDMKEYVLFRYFTFPIFTLSKVQMSAMADEQGWKEIMEMTWFCHNPTRNMKPCGVCQPCEYTIEEGLGKRMPARSRVTFLLHRRLIRPLKRRAKIMLSPWIRSQ